MNNSYILGFFTAIPFFFLFPSRALKIFSIIYCSLRVSWLFSIFSSPELTVKAFINVDTNFKYTAASLYKTITFHNNICSAIFFYQVLWFSVYLFCELKDIFFVFFTCDVAEQLLKWLIYWCFFIWWHIPYLKWRHKNFQHFSDLFVQGMCSQLHNTMYLIKNSGYSWTLVVEYLVNALTDVTSRYLSLALII